MHRFDRALTALQHRVRRQPLLYRLTLGTRVLLAAGFVPTGLVKLLGMRFTTMSPESPIGGFFETLYQSGPYWRFLGAAQVLAGLLVLWPASATLGALAFLAIILNIFVITLSYDFRGTPVVTGLMLLATLYLLLWDYDRLRGLVGLPAGSSSERGTLPRLRLGGPVERAVYAIGAVAGLGLFAALRGLLFPPSWTWWFVLAGGVSAGVALVLGLARARTGAAEGGSAA